MSFIRLGQDNSSVYIYDDFTTGPCCCFCSLVKVIRQRTDAELDAMWPPVSGTDREAWRNVYEPDFSTRDLTAMLAHIRQHRDAGDVVPDWLDQQLRDEWPAAPYPEVKR